MICVDCSAASDFNDGRKLTPERAEAFAEIKTLIGLSDLALLTKKDGDQIIELLHARCAARGGCPCQHGRYIEMDPDPNGFQGYVDALPEGHPYLVAYEKRVGRKVPR